MQTRSYLQDVLLLMLASKPVLVSAKRSDKGKFSKEQKNNAVDSHFFKALHFFSSQNHVQGNLLTPPPTHNLEPSLS